MGNVGITEILLIFIAPLVIGGGLFFALGYFVGKNVGMKEGLRERMRP